MSEGWENGIRAGQLRHRLQILNPTEGAPNVVQAWHSDGFISCEVMALSSSEAVRQGAQTSTVTYQITSRHTTKITTFSRLKEGTKTYQLTSVIPDGKKRWLLMTAVERVGD